MPIRLAPSSRSFCFTFTIAWLLVITSIFIYGASTRYGDNFDILPLNATNPSPPCRIKYFSSDQCQFVGEHCGRINDMGMIPYLKWYYCGGRTARAGLMVALLVWLTVIFAAMATAADRFLAVNLASLVHSLKISENLAGVTIFAFGNGSSDLFSTLAAMNGGNGSLAIAELFGAAAFITTMVLGAIAIIRPFGVDRKAFLGDVVCFLLAASVNLALISDGSLALWESFVIIGLYASFVAFVLLRDRNKVKDKVTESAKEEALADSDDDILSAEEDTSLLSDTTEVVTYVAKSDDRKPSAASSKTIVVVESITEGIMSGENSSTSVSSDATSVNDWASEYEHMADTPPFIKLCEGVWSFQIDGVKSLLSTLIRLPATVLIGLTTITQPEIEHAAVESLSVSDSTTAMEISIIHEPDRHPKEFWLLCIQVMLGPQFLGWLFWSHAGKFDISKLLIGCLVLLGASMLFLAINWTSLLHPGRRLHLFLSTAGFLTATSWIYVLASEAVALIETLGVISDVSDALLGATVFAIGNSSDDIFANLSVAKRGHPVLASAACLGGPMLNTLLGIGFGSLIQIVRGNYQPYVFHVPASLFVSAASLLTGLSVVLGYVLFSGGRLDKFLGYGLMSVWVSFTAVNVYVSMQS